MSRVMLHTCCPDDISCTGTFTATARLLCGRSLCGKVCGLSSDGKQRMPSLMPLRTPAKMRAQRISRQPLRDAGRWFDSWIFISWNAIPLHRCYDVGIYIYVHLETHQTSQQQQLMRKSVLCCRRQHPYVAPQIARLTLKYTHAAPRTH